MIIKILAICILLFVLIYGVYLMNNHSKVIKDDWFKVLKYEKRIAVTSLIKASWKKSIILLSLVVAVLLIIISTFIGNGNRYEHVIVVLAIATSIIVFLSLLVNDKKYRYNIEKIEK